MFRLIQIQPHLGTARIFVDADGFASEHAALERFRDHPGGLFGVGRFDGEGTLAEIIMDTGCGPVGDCPRPASLVHAKTFQRLCDICGAGLDVLSVRELAVRLGIAVRLAPVLTHTGRYAAADVAFTAANRIARELAGRIEDPAWRQDLCAELARNPSSVNGLLIGVGALSHRDVLDLYHALRALGEQLPAAVHGDLLKATARPLSPAGVTAYRLGI